MTEQSNQVENSPEPSPFILAIMKIAMEEGDYISEETMKELEAMVRPDRPSKKYLASYGLIGETTEERVETLKNLIDGVKKLVEVGSFVSDKLGKYLGPIGTVAGFVKDIIEFFEEEKPDPVMKELGELKKQLSALSEKMTSQFDDLKSFIVEQNFCNRYTSGMVTVFMYMLDTFSSPTKESLNLFEEVYREHKPQKLVYEMLTKLEQEASNPLKWAMKSSVNSKVQFDKWKGVLDGVLTQALFIEMYASGILSGVGVHGVNKILEKIARYQELVKQWRTYYLATSDYWPTGVRKFVNDVHDNSGLTTHKEKVDVLWKNIDTILTDDKFYAVVLPDGHIYRYSERFEGESILSVRDGFVIMVLRITKRPEATIPTRKWLQTHVNTNRLNGWHSMFWNLNYWSIVRDYFQMDRVNRFSKAANAFVFLVAQEEKFISIRHSEIKDWNYGPGFYTFGARLSAYNEIATVHFPVFYLFGGGQLGS